MSIKDYLMSISLNKKLIGMMLLLSVTVITVLMFLYAQSEKALMNELENQTAELSKAIQVGVEEVTSIGSTDQMRLQTYLKKLNAKGVKRFRSSARRMRLLRAQTLRKSASSLELQKKSVL